MMVHKPTWATDPEAVDFKLIDEPLVRALNLLLTELNEQASEPSQYYFILHGLLQVSFETYKAIRGLVAEEKKYPIQAHMLDRSIIDTFFTVALLTERPEENATRYRLAGYRAFYEQFERQRHRYGGDPKWTDYLKASRDFVDKTVIALKLTEQEKKNPSAELQYWPIPGQIIRSKPPLVNDQKLAFLEEVYGWRYSEISDINHQGWHGMTLGLYGLQPQEHWHQGKFESDAVYTAILFLLMVISEIAASERGGQNEKLKYLWTILGTYFAEAADYYRLRFQELLSY